MTNIDTVFLTQVETAVQTAVGSNKVLIVYLAPAKIPTVSPASTAPATTTNIDNGEPESDDTWINQLITADTLSLIQTHSIGLKLIESTQQFELFKQIFPQVVVPSLFCIKVNSVLDVIFGDVTKEQFEERLKRVVQPAPSGEDQGTTPPVVTQYNHQVPASTAPHQAQAQAPAQGNNTTVPHRSSSTQNHTSSAFTRAQHTPPSVSTSSSTTGSPAVPEKTFREQIAEESIKRYHEEQLRKKRQEREDRERIKRLLKADEEERKAQAKRQHEQRERERRLSNDHSLEQGDEANIDEILQESTGSLKDNIHHHNSKDQVCSLAIRLLNGLSIKHDFKPSTTLNEVRQWVDDNRSDGDAPYCFHRTIPRITYETTDEERSLEALELTPRSALILKPVNNYTNAYEGSTQGSGVLGRVYQGVTSLLGFGGSSITQSGPTPSVTNQPSQIVTNSEPQYQDNPSTSSPAATSPQLSSYYASPLHSPHFAHSSSNSALNLSHPSSLNLNLNLGSNNPTRAVSPPLPPPLRPGTPGSMSRIRTLQDHRDEADDRVVYNGNQLDLEDDKKAKNAANKNHGKKE